jgi:hypothetical protein
MAILVTLAQAKGHLNVTWPDTDPRAANLQLTLDTAQAIILDAINQSNPDYWPAVTATWTDETTVPLSVHRAILLQLGELDWYRGDEADNQAPARDAGLDDLSPRIRALLRLYRDTVIG